MVRLAVKDSLFKGEGNRSVKIYKLTIPRYRIGSNESLAFLDALLKFEVHDIFQSIAVENMLEFHYKEIRHIGYCVTAVKLVLLIALWFTQN
jgi:hypothetical protein